MNKTQTDSKEESLTTPVHKCLKMINKVEDMVLTFQSNQNSPRSPRRENKPRVQTQVYETIPPLKKAVEVLKNRIATAPITNMNVPNVLRFKQVLPTDCLLGPGYYKFTEKKVQQGIEFSSISKIEDKVAHRLNVIRVKRRSNSIEDVSKLTIFEDPLEKMPKITNFKEKAKLFNERIEMVKGVGREIKEVHHESIKKKLFDKLERIKWHEKKEEILTIKATWRSFISQVAVASLLHLKIKNFKVFSIQNIKKRTRKILKSFRICLVFFSKMLRILLKRRRKKMYKVNCK